MPRIDAATQRPPRPESQPSPRNNDAKAQAQARQNSEVTSERRVERNSSAQSRRAAQDAAPLSDHRAAIPNSALGRNLDVTA